MKRDAKGSIYKWEELGPVMTCLIGCVDDPGEFCNEGEGKTWRPDLPPGPGMMHIAMTSELYDKRFVLVVSRPHSRCCLLAQRDLMTSSSVTLNRDSDVVCVISLLFLFALRVARMLQVVRGVSC